MLHEVRACLMKGIICQLMSIKLQTAGSIILEGESNIIESKDKINLKLFDINIRVVRGASLYDASCFFLASETIGEKSILMII